MRTGLAAANKKRFYDLLFEALLRYERMLISKQSVAEQDFTKRVRWISQSAEKEKTRTGLARVQPQTEIKDFSVQIKLAGFSGRAFAVTSDPSVVLGEGLQKAVNHMEKLIDADHIILEQHKSFHKEAMRAAFCVGNPIDLLHKLHRTHAVLYEMSVTSRELRDACIEKYLASAGEDYTGELSQNNSTAIAPELKQQLKKDFADVLAKPKPIPQSKLDEVTRDQFEGLLELVLRMAYFQQSSVLANSVLVERTVFFSESIYVARTFLVRAQFNNFFNFIPRPSAANFSNVPYAAWMRFFQDHQNSPYASSLKQAVELGQNPQERQFRHS